MMPVQNESVSVRYKAIGIKLMWEICFSTVEISTLHELSCDLLTTYSLEIKYMYSSICTRECCLILKCNFLFIASAVSRAILKPVYRFGIRNSNPQTLKSVDFWCKLSSLFLVAEPRERCFELFRTENSHKFPGFRPWTLLGRAYSAAPDSQLHNGTPKKLLDTALIALIFMGIITLILVGKPQPSGLLEWKIFWKKELMLKKNEDVNFKLFM